MSSTTLAQVLKLVFFLSGCAGLIYEVIWTRLFSEVLGSSALSTTAVFSIFLLSLALGAEFFGRKSVEGKEALRLYGWIELGVAISGSLATALLFFGGHAIAALRFPTDIKMISLVTDLFWTLLVIGVPTFFMGGSLPVILNVLKATQKTRDIATRLYAWNTLGAACGTLLAGFYLIWNFGLLGTAGIAVGINLLLGFASLFLSPKLKTIKTIEKKQNVAETLFSWDRWTWQWLTFLSGFVSLAYEVLWGRLARFVIGERTISTAALLFIFITCLGVGAWLAPVLGRYLKSSSLSRTRNIIAGLLLSTAILHLVCVAVCFQVIQQEGVVFAERMQSELFERIQTLWLLMAVPILVLGLVFPLLLWSAKATESQPGRTVGNLYMINTIGAALGAIVATFAFSPGLGTAGGFLAVTGLLVLVSVVLIALNRKTYGILLGALICLGFVYGGQYFPRSLVVLREDEQLLESNEDEYGVQVLTKTSLGTMRMRNNRRQLVRDIGDPKTTYAQQMSAHLAVLMAEKCHEVLNIGTGYGITAGTITLYDEVQSIETIELLPFVADLQSDFADYNFEYLNDPRVEFILGDGSKWLQTSNKKYDVISINVLDPHLPGSSSLYTTDFWTIARNHLNTGGVLTQLIWGEKAIPILVNGLEEVFPVVSFFPAYDGQAYNVLAFKDDTPTNSKQIHLERINSRAKSELKSLIHKDPFLKLPEIIRASQYDTKYLSKRARDSKNHLHTRNFPILEFLETIQK